MKRCWLWIARLLIGLVFFFNIQCAVVFLVHPAWYAPAFELSGVAGRAAIQGYGILFLMWNVPYAAALYQPHRYRLALILAILMQATGVVGETLLLLNLEAGHPLLSAAIRRFIFFDAGGLIVLLLAAAALTQINTPGASTL